MDLLNSGLIDKVSIDADQADPLLHLLDAVVIKLEGGTEEDLKVLDVKPPAPKEVPAILKEKVAEKEKPVETEKPKEEVSIKEEKSSSAMEEGEDGEEEKPKQTEESEDIESTEKTTEEPELKSSEAPTEEQDEEVDEKNKKKKNKKKKKKKQKDVIEQNGDLASKDVDDNQLNDDEKSEKINETIPTKDEENPSNDDDDTTKDEQIVEKIDEQEKSIKPTLTIDQINPKKRKRTNSSSSSSSSSSHSSTASSSSSSSNSSSSSEKPENNSTSINNKSSEKKSADAENTSVASDDIKKDKKNESSTSISPKKKQAEPEAVIDLATEDKEKEPRALHKTSSIFLRNLAPTITKAEVEAMCKRFPGFLRVAIADPQPERRWFRRGWVSFERQVNIKEICWSLNNIRLRDCELGAIVNRDLLRRIRTVNGITAHKQIVRHDIKLSAKIVHNLDLKVGLWSTTTKRNDDIAGKLMDIDKNDNASEAEQAAFGLSSKNPILKNITDYLIEEASAEEEELLGVSGDQEEGQLGDGEGPIERDPTLITVLDRLILYLRIVHSVDYYNHCEYPNEDEMPNRCGIMHVRGPAPTAKVTSSELQEYCRNFETKMNAFLTPAVIVAIDDFDKLGAKDSEAEVEKFVQANTQELAKDKWLCPLSGKKFKGPDFIRKHIFNKHGEKVSEVKAEAEYFNNYLKDPKRPMLPEHPGNKAPVREAPRENFPSYGGMGGG